MVIHAERANRQPAIRRSIENGDTRLVYVMMEQSPKLLPYSDYIILDE